MFKKFTIALAAAMLMFYSSMALAGMYTSTKQGYYRGAPVYWVKVHNDTPYRKHCTLTASNGAEYHFKISAWSSSYWKRINNPYATYVYVCN